MLLWEENEIYAKARSDPGFSVWQGGATCGDKTEALKDSKGSVIWSIDRR